MEIENICNIHKIAKGIQPILNKNNLIKKLYFKPIDELKRLKNQQKLVDIEERTFDKNLILIN